MNDDLPTGSIAYGQYEFRLNGERGSIALTLGDPALDDPITMFARERVRAIRFGMINILGITDGPLHPILWAQTATRLAIVPSAGDRDPGPELQAIITEHLGIFFDEIAPLVPDLAALSLYASHD